MMKSKTSMLVLTLALLAGLTGVMGLVLGDPRIPLPGSVERWWRTITVVLAGASLGFMTSCAWHITRIRIDQSDTLLRLLAALGLSYLLLTAYITIELVSILGQPYITWRTPLSFVAFTVASTSSFILMRKTGALANAAKDSRAVIKLTLLDTGKPGPDIDLDKVTK